MSTSAVRSSGTRSGNGADHKIVLNDVTLTSNTPDDPTTSKRFGFVAARPSEYLIVYRAGVLREKVSGQGGRCFKWPSDTVVVVPTTLKEVLFQAKYKAEKEREAQLAQLESRREVARREINDQRELEQERHNLELETARLETARQLEKIAQSKQCDEEQFEADRRRVEEEERTSLFKTQQAEERNRLRAESERQQAEIRVAAEKLANEEQVRALRERIAAESDAGPSSMERLFMTEALPMVAQALASSLTNSRFNVYQTGNGNGGGASPFHFALREALDLLHVWSGAERAGAVEPTVASGEETVEPPEEDNS